MIWLKIVHIAAISLWSAGLISLPALYVRRSHIHQEEQLHRLHAIVRFLYVGLLSPAAYLSIATGIALIFVRQNFETWFSIKLVFVGLLVSVHILTGLVIIRLFDKGSIYPLWRFFAVTAATCAIVLAIFTIVLAKPYIPDLVPEALRRPGGLEDILGFNPFRKS